MSQLVKEGTGCCHLGLPKALGAQLMLTAAEKQSQLRLQLRVERVARHMEG